MKPCKYCDKLPTSTGWRRPDFFHQQYHVEGKRYDYHPKMVFVMLFMMMITKYVYNLKQHMVLLTKLNQAINTGGSNPNRYASKTTKNGGPLKPILKKTWRNRGDLKTWRGSPPSMRWKMWWNMWTNTSRWEPTSSPRVNHTNGHPTAGWITLKCSVFFLQLSESPDWNSKGGGHPFFRFYVCEFLGDFYCVLWQFCDNVTLFWETCWKC